MLGRPLRWLTLSLLIVEAALVATHFSLPLRAGDLASAAVVPLASEGEIATIALETNAPRQLMPTVGGTLPGEVRAAAYTYDPTSAYDQKGTEAPRGFSAQTPTELIDPFSGNLILRHVDLTLPGVGGLDLTLQRVYNSKIHRNYAARASGDSGRVALGMLFVPPSPLGLGWNMHLGRIVGGVNDGPNENLPGPRYYEAPDGSQHPFFTYAGTGCGNGSNAVCLVTKNFDNPYQLVANGPWYLATADGLNLTFSHSAFDGSTIVHYVTEIRDVQGNRIQISYHDNSIPGIGVQRDYFNHYIDTILDSAGRTISFGYSVVNQPDVVRLTSITAVGRVYSYGYTAGTPWAPIYAFLASAQPPTGAPWRYAYAGLSNGDCEDNGQRWCELTQITYPAGGTVTYGYDDLLFYAQANPMAVRAVIARTIGGREIAAATWSYAYNRAANYSGSEHTVITKPDGSQELYTYFGVGEGTYNPLGLAWKAGVLLQKRVREDGNILQTESYNWIASPAISDEVTGDPWIGFDIGVFLPRLQELTIQRGNLSWTTTHTTFNDLNNTPRCSTESGDEATRYRLNTYQGMFTQQGDYLFVWVNLPMLSGLSYTPFTAAQCDPAQSSSWTPAVVDEITVQEHDGEGQPTSQAINGLINDYQYHGDGSLKAEIFYQGANRTVGFCTVYSNYQNGVARTTTYGAVAPACSGGLYSTERVLNSDGSVQRATDGRGFSTSFLYDGLGRRTRIEPPGQAPIVITYDGSAASFNTLRHVEQGEYWLEDRFDGFGRTLEKESSAGVHLTESYDALNRLSFRSLPSATANSSEGETFTYDALGRPLTISHSDGTISYGYGTDAHTVTITDEASRVTTHTRLAFSHPNDFWLLRVQLPGEAAPTADIYSYLVGGHLSGIDYGGRQRIIEYNFAKQVKRVFHPETGNTFFGYDAAGNLRCRHWTPLCNDAGYSNPGIDIRYTVNGLAQITQVNFAGGGTVTMSYDNSGNVESMSDAAGTHEFEYAPSNRLEQRTTTIDGVSYVTGYGYDDRGNMTSLTYPSGRVVIYERDSGNRIEAIQGLVSAIEYHPNGWIRSMTYANGIVTTLSLDSRQRPDVLQAAGVLNLNYDFDDVGNLDRLVDNLTPANTIDFGYDDRNRLTSASGAWGSLGYGYNQAGDRTSETLNGQNTTYSYDEGLLTGLSGRVNLNYGYDGKGNVSSRGNYSYQYDENDRLVAVSSPDGRTEYEYDGVGEKMVARRQGCQNSLVYIYDQEGNRIAEYSLEGALRKEYVSLQGQPIVDYSYDPGSVSVTEIDFGDVELFTTVTRTVTIENGANTPINLSDFNLNLPFGVGIAEPIAIAANSSIELPITFRALQRGEVTAQVESCSASGLRVELSLRGRGVAARAEVAMEEVDLGDVPFGNSVTRMVVVSSTGDIPLQIQGWFTATGLSVAPATPVTVQPGEAQTFTVHFDTTLSCGGPFEGQLNLESNSDRNTLVTVKANVLALAVDAPDMNFGPLGMGESRTLEVTLRNRAAIPLTPVLTFDGAPHFSVGTLPSAAIAPGESVQIAVSYRAGAKLWSPFGDHAMLRAGFAECSLVCDASAHLIGNAAIENVPQGGLMPALALAGDSVHVASILSRTLHYAVRDGAGVWTQGVDPSAGADVTEAPALVAAGERVTVLWEEYPFTINLRQRVGQADWGAVCSLEGFRRGWGPLAVDSAGNVWLAWLDRATYALNASRPFVANACQASQTPAISSPGISWDNLNLATGPDGHMGLAVTQAERLRFLDLDLAAGDATLETPHNSEVGFGATAAIAADSQGGWHLIWPEIFIGVGYTAPARYIYRDPVQGWGEPLTLMPDSNSASSLHVAVDSGDGVHAAWSDLACAPPDRRKIYYATKPAFENEWQVSDVSTPGYDGFDIDLTMVMEDDHLVALWNGYDENGATRLLFGASEAASQAISTTITSDAGGSLISPNGNFEAIFPPGAVDEETLVTYTRQAQPAEEVGSLSFAGHAFTLVAEDSNGAVTQFDPPYTLVLRYDERDWQDAGIGNEEDLNLYFWDGTAWQGVLPCAGCSLDTAANTLTVLLNHLTEFALMAPAEEQRVHLPVVKQRGEE